MTAGELEELFWRRSEDLGKSLLWAGEFMAWLNEAQIEACRRARLLVDSRTVALCQVPLVPGVESYLLDPRIIYLRRVKLASRTIPLDEHDYRDMDWNAPGWESHEGNVTGYIRGLDTSRLRIYRIPTEADTVNLLVVREPLVKMGGVDDAPEIMERYHQNLLHWVYYRAYSKKESEAWDQKLAAEHLGLFEGEFGTRNKASALEEEWTRNYMPYHQQDGNF